MSPTLTPKKKKILEFIEKYTAKQGYSPTLQEIAKKFKLKSIATVHQHLEELKNSGYLIRGFNKARDVSVTDVETQNFASRNSENTITLPIAGLIAAGEPIEAIEDKSETLTIPRELINDDNSYILKVKGDSMVESLISDGDFVIVQKQDIANNGDIVVALLDDGSATLKEFHKEKNYIRLQPRNKKYKPLHVKNVIIQGKVAGIIRKF
ncbi:MAG: transcriptional repressor LexA [Patescibacteria group bacterium]